MAEYLFNNTIVMPGQRFDETIDMGNLPVHYQTRPSPARWRRLETIRVSWDSISSVTPQWSRKT
uniref:Uncharacterized protein n=1 Tax=Leersia perrieri TaxID=77586 RepID=A0A0D9XYJ3_9ORYZ